MNSGRDYYGRWLGLPADHPENDSDVDVDQSDCLACDGSGEEWDGRRCAACGGKCLPRQNTTHHEGPAT